MKTIFLPSLGEVTDSDSDDEFDDGLGWLMNIFFFQIIFEKFEMIKDVGGLNKTLIKN